MVKKSLFFEKSVCEMFGQVWEKGLLKLEKNCCCNIKSQTMKGYKLTCLFHLNIAFTFNGSLRASACMINCDLRGLKYVVSIFSRLIL